MNNISQKIIETIKSKGITPTPKWRFVLRNIVFWGITVLCVLVGGLAFSLILQLIKMNDWDLYPHVAKSLPGFIFMTLPYFWIILLALFSVFAYYNFRHTKGGYRYKLYAIVITNIFLSVILGLVFHDVGLAKIADRMLEKFPPYGTIAHIQPKIWTQADAGRLAGTILSLNGIDEFILEDLQKEQWNVVKGEALLIKGVKIGAGEKVRVVGENTEENIFIAEIIGPWMPERELKDMFLDIKDARERKPPPRAY